MILRNVLNNRNYQMNSREFTFLIFLVGMFITINTLIFLTERIFLWEELKNNFISSGGAEFNENIFNAISLSSYFIPFGGILVFVVFLIFSYKKNGTSYFFPIAWSVIWLLSIIGIWFNKSITILNMSLMTILGIAFISYLSFLFYKVRIFKKQIYLINKYEKAGGIIIEDIPILKSSKSLLQNDFLINKRKLKQNYNDEIKVEKEKIMQEMGI